MISRPPSVSRSKHVLITESAVGYSQGLTIAQHAPDRLTAGQACIVRINRGKEWVAPVVIHQGLVKQVHGEGIKVTFLRLEKPYLQSTVP